MEYRDVHIIEHEPKNTHFYVESERDEKSDPVAENLNQELLETSVEEDFHSVSDHEEPSISVSETNDSDYVPVTDVEASSGKDVRKSQRQKKPKMYDDSVTYFTTENQVSVENLTCLQEALSGPNSEKWIIAMKSESQSFTENRAWDVVTLPEGQKAIKCKWVYKRKSNSDRSAIFRAR